MPENPEDDPARPALICAEVAYEKKAEEIVILDVSKILVITSYFVIASGGNRKQLQAMADGMQEKLRPLGIRRRGTEGYDDGKWILIDYGDVIVQLFDAKVRGFYNLEMVWGDAPRVPFTPPAPAPAPKT